MRSTEQLVSIFAANAFAQQESIERGDSKASNRHANRLLRAFEDLIKGYGDTGRAALKILLTDDRDYVRVTAAAFLLRFATEPSLEVLNAVANDRSFAGLCAFECLKRWEEKEWSLDL